MATIFTALGAYAIDVLVVGGVLGLGTLLFISLVSSMSVAVMAVVFSFAATYASYRMGIDPDDTTIPIVTNIVDVFGMVIFIGVSAVVLGFNASNSLLCRRVDFTDISRSDEGCRQCI